VLQPEEEHGLRNQPLPRPCSKYFPCSPVRCSTFSSPDYTGLCSFIACFPIDKTLRFFYSSACFPVSYAAPALRSGEEEQSRTLRVDGGDGHRSAATPHSVVPAPAKSPLFCCCYFPIKKAKKIKKKMHWAKPVCRLRGILSTAASCTL